MTGFSIKSKFILFKFRFQNDQPQLKQFQRASSNVPESGQHSGFQITGSNINKVFSPERDITSFGNPHVLQPLSGEQIVNYPKSPKNDFNHIYKQTLKRPNYSKNQGRVGKKVNNLYPSPYNTKNQKYRTVKKSSNEPIFNVKS